MFCTKASGPEPVGISRGYRTTKGMRNGSSYMMRLSKKPCSPIKYP